MSSSSLLFLLRISAVEFGNMLMAFMGIYPTIREEISFFSDSCYKLVVEASSKLIDLHAQFKWK